MNSSEAINALRSTSKRSQCDIVRQRHTAGLRATFTNSQSVFGAETHTEPKVKLLHALFGVLMII